MEGDPSRRVAAVRCPRNATGEGQGGRGWQGTCPSLAGCAGGTKMPLEARPRAACQHRARGPGPARAAPCAPRPEGCEQGTQGCHV